MTPLYWYNRSMKKKSLEQGGGPLVSVLVPIYNVEKFLDQCLASLMTQTLQDIEFICLNDGSTDGSLEIIKHYMAMDRRFKLLDKPNSGYGDSMNQGLAIVKGKYIGIVESDDWAEPTMFADLAKLAEDNNAQAVKSNFYFYSSLGGGSSKKFAIVDPTEVGTIINPRQTPHIFKGMSTIWSGLYNRQFLIDNNIDFVPSPGASYQDTAFNFKVWAAATRVVYTNEAYLHYRIDNEQSSVKSRAKVFCVCDEFASIKQYLLDHNLMDELKAVYTQRKFDIYYWNLGRLDGQNLVDFAERMSEEFCQDQADDYFDTSLCDPDEIGIITAIMNNPAKFIRRRQLRRLAAKPYHLAGRIWNRLNRGRAKRLRIIDSLINAQQENDEALAKLEYNRLDNPTKYLGSDDTKDVAASIIVPVYNAAEFLPRTLDSLVKQTLHNIEIICVDDGSTDDSLKILKKYAKQDERIKVYHQANAGVATARNMGLKHATGKYIMWCDSDDTYTSNMCLKMYNMMEQRQVDLAICSQNIIYDGIDKSLRKDTSSYLDHKYQGAQLINWELITNTDVSLWNKIFRRDIIEQNNLRFPDGLLFEDAYFCNTYMLMSRTIYYSDQRLYNYIRQPGSIMSTSFKKNKSSGDYLKITMKLYEFLNDQSMYNSYADFFWLRVIQDYSYARDNQDKAGRIEATEIVDEFIDAHRDDFTKATPGMQKAVRRTLNHSARIKMLVKTKEMIKRVMNKLSPRRRQMNQILQLSNQLTGQAKYMNYLIDSARRNCLRQN